MKRLLFLLALLAPEASAASSPCWWFGTEARCFPSSGIALHDNRAVRFMETTANGVNYGAIVAPTSLAGNYTLTLPVDDGTASQWTVTDGSGVLSFTNTTTTGKTIDGSADEVQLTVQGHSTQTSNILLTEKSDGTDLLTIDNSGRVVAPLQPMFEAYNSSADTGLASGSTNTVEFNTETFDIGGNFASNTFTAPVTANYMLCANADVSGAVSLTSVSVNFNISGVLFSVTRAAGLATSGPVSNVSCIVRRMAATDTAFVRVTATTASSTYNINAGQGTTYFHGTLLH